MYFHLFNVYLLLLIIKNWYYGVVGSAVMDISGVDSASAPLQRLGASLDEFC